MGDNRDNSADSRFFGFLPVENVVARPTIVFWSYADDPGVHEISGLMPTLGLYASRISSFFTKTRWERTLQALR